MTKSMGIICILILFMFAIVTHGVADEILLKPSNIPDRPDLLSAVWSICYDTHASDWKICIDNSSGVNGFAVMEILVMLLNEQNYEVIITPSIPNTKQLQKKSTWLEK